MCVNGWDHWRSHGGTTRPLDPQEIGTKNQKLFINTKSATWIFELLFSSAKDVLIAE